jgi:hypothetical protein
MTTQHTPGPWEQNGRYIESNGMTICEMFGENLDEREASARLIAAAPELLDALKRIEAMCFAPPDFSDATIQEIASTAIAKATGQA